MPDIYLRGGAANPADIILRDPTQPDVTPTDLPYFLLEVIVEEPLEFELNPLDLWSLPEDAAVVVADQPYALLDDAIDAEELDEAGLLSASFEPGDLAYSLLDDALEQEETDEPGLLYAAFDGGEWVWSTPDDALEADDYDSSPLDFWFAFEDAPVVVIDLPYTLFDEAIDAEEFDESGLVYFSFDAPDYQASTLDEAIESEDYDSTALDLWYALENGDQPYWTFDDALEPDEQDLSPLDLWFALEDAAAAATELPYQLLSDEEEIDYYFSDSSDFFFVYEDAPPIPPIVVVGSPPGGGGGNRERSIMWKVPYTRDYLDRLKWEQIERDDEEILLG